MAEAENQSSVGLPVKLRAQFSELERRLWKLETGVAVCSALVGLGFSYLLLFLSDRVWDTPVWLRLAIVLSGLAVVMAAAAIWSKRWIFHRRDRRALANLVQKKFRRLGDRLLGIVELADEEKRPPNFSLALYRAAIEQVAADAAQYDFRQSVNARTARFQGIALFLLLALLLVPGLLVPAAGWNTFQRWSKPTAAIARYTLVQLEELPTREIVAHGESFEIKARVQYRSFWRPTRARSQYESQPKIEAAVENGWVRFQVPGEVQAGILRIRLGDATRTVAVAPTYRPSLKELSAMIQLPEYLQYPKQAEKIQNGSLPVLEGSRVTFHGQTSRALASAQVRLETNNPQALAVQAAAFNSDPLNLEGVFQCGFTWRDELGLESVAPWRLTIQPQKDSPPTPEFVDLAREVAILETEVLQLKTVGRDDFGVRELGLAWELVTEWQTTNNTPPRVFKVDSKSPQEKQLETTFRFSPALLNIPADSAVELRAYAKDAFPKREPSLSPVYRILVLGNERHAEMIRQKLESLLARLEEVTRLEEKIAADTRDLKELPQEKMDAKETGERVGETKDEQTQNAAQLEELAKEGTKTLREAFRNPTLPEKTLRDWAKNVQDMQELSQQQMQDAAQSLKAAQQNAQSRPQELAKALEKQEEALQDLQQLQKKINQGLDNLQALTLAQRLRKVATEEKDIAGLLQKNISETIGLLAKDLPVKYRKANAYMSDDQENAQKETQVLQGEISRFFERTQQENYGQVSQEMTAAKPSDAMDKVRGLIAENIAMEAIQQLGAWSERFHAWADILEPKKEAGTGGSGGGGNGANPMSQLLNQLLSLLRLREGEMNLQQRTLVLDRQKDDAGHYADAANGLYLAQRNLLKKMLQMQMENEFPPLVEPFKEIFGAMENVEMMLGKPLTDQTVQAAETKSIDVLSDVINLINEQAKQGGSPQMSSQQEMAFLLQMMAPEKSQSQGMAVGRNPGRSTAGGTTDRPAMPLEGDAQGNSAEARHINRASGVTGNLPTEFRDALESYFNAIEKDGN